MNFRKASLTTCVVSIALLLTQTAFAASLILYVAPDGNDGWSGRLPEANAQRSDGPLATPHGARDAIRRWRKSEPGGAGPVTVNFRGGTYWLTAPWVLEPQDSGTAEAPVVYVAATGERPVLSGGRPITGWKANADGLWSTQIPDVASGPWYFQQLWVGGQRRTRARTPNQDYYSIAQKAPPATDPATGKQVPRDRTAFIFTPNEIKNWPDLADAQVIVFHSWETSRLRIASVNEAERLVTFTGGAAWPFENWGPQQRYYVENVREALDAPGEWYLDRASGTLFYYPLPGEDLTRSEVVAPRLTRLVEVRGAPEAKQFVEHVTLRGLTFSHADWLLEPQGHSDAQAAVSASAAMLADGARHCVIEDCELSHVGDYGIWLRHGCQHNRLVRNRLRDLGVGGIRIGEAARAATDDGESTANVVDNNHLFDGGHVYPAGVGIWVAQSSYNTISHNEIHDFCYSGLSIGWNWDDAPNRCHHNVIEYNHVHHVMQGMLSDGGAIYTLGTSPGSIIRNNVFHDVWPYQTPPFGWGIYLDATCSGYLVENNIVYNTLSGGLMYNNGGHEHTIRNNIFAFSANHMLWPYWEKRPNCFQRNIVYLTQGELFIPFAERSLRERLAAKESLGVWDDNLYWHPDGQERLRFFKHELAPWQALGLDTHSQIADPRFVRADDYDFRLQPDSPALKLGFQPIDASRVGLYGDSAWVEEARQVKHPKTILPPPPVPPQPQEVDDGFETTSVGAPPQGAIVSGEAQGASIRVTDEQAATGKRSLKFTDRQDLQPSWQPHLFYQPHITAGAVRQSFDLRLERDALLFTEWRDETVYPQCIGPSVTFDGAGKVMVGGKLLTTVPTSVWVHLEIEASLGKTAPPKFTLTIVPPNGQRQVFADLPWAGTDFRELQWLGFVSTAAADCVFYLDNVQIQRIDRRND
jgi:Right handed beta helix region